MINREHTIVFIANYLNLSGVTTFLKELSTYLIQKDFKTIIVGKKTNCDIRDYFPTDSVYEIPSVDNKVTSIFHMLQTSIINIYTYLIYIKQIQKNHSISIIHFQEPFLAAFIILIYAKISGIKTIYTIHGDKEEELNSEKNNHPLRKLKIFYIHYLQYFFMLLIDNNVAVSIFCESQIQRKYHLNTNKMHLIRNGVMQKNITTNRSIVENQNKFYNLLNISRFERRKGHQLLLYAFKLVHEYIPNSQLIISGPLTNEINPIFQTYESLQLFDSIHILHDSSTYLKDKLFHNSDVFIMPSIDQENCPFSVLESIAYGIPVICTPNGGLPEIVAKINKNLISKDYRPESLAEVIIWYLLLNKPDKLSIINKGYTVINQYFNSEKQYQKYLNVYQFTNNGNSFKSNGAN